MLNFIIFIITLLIYKTVILTIIYGNDQCIINFSRLIEIS